MLKLIELLRKSASKLPKTTSEKPLKRLLNWPFKPARLWQQGIETWQPSSGHLVPDALTFTLRQSCIHFFLPILFIYIVGSTVALLFLFFLFSPSAQCRRVSISAAVLSLWPRHLLSVFVQGSFKCPAQTNCCG